MRLIFLILSAICFSTLVAAEKEELNGKLGPYSISVDLTSWKVVADIAEANQEVIVFIQEETGLFATFTASTEATSLEELQTAYLDEIKNHMPSPKLLHSEEREVNGKTMLYLQLITQSCDPTIIVDSYLYVSPAYALIVAFGSTSDTPSDQLAFEDFLSGLCFESDQAS